MPIPDGEAAAERHAAVVTLLELAEDVARRRSGRRRRGVRRRGPAAGGHRGRRRRRPESSCSPSTEPRASSGRPSSCPHSRKGSCRSGRRPNPPSSPRNDGCSTWGSPALDGTSGCRGRPHGPARPDARADERGRGSSMASCRGPRSPGGRWRRMVAGRRPRRAPVDRRWTRPTGRRCRTRSVPGGRPVPGPNSIAPFIVFHDTTIEAIAAARPRSIAELRRVPGVGPTKLDRYGEEIIGVVIREA